MVMPEMDGRECFARFRAINPGIKAILSTGYGRDGRAQDILTDGMRGLAQMPYRVAELSRVMTDALG